MVYPPDLSFGPDTRIVLVGTTHCPWDEEFLPPVPHAKNNIDELYRLFTAADICGLDEGCIVRVLDWENASEITEQIARAAKEATDTLVVYYAGHGLYGDAENPLYLAAKKTTEERKAFNGVPVSLVRKAIHSSSARKRILILDCCYSGRAMDGLLAPTGAKAAVEPAIDIEGTYGIAAVPANAKALAPPGEKFTRFTGALLEVLEKGLATGQQVLTLEDVFTEVERKIGRMGDAPPPKRINWDNGQKFRIARNRSPYYREPDQGPNTSSLSRIGEAVQNILKPGVWAETPNPSQRPRGPAEESSLQRSPPEPSRNSAVIYDPGHASPPESGGFLQEFDASDLPPRIPAHPITQAEWFQIPRGVRSLLKELRGFETDRLHWWARRLVLLCVPSSCLLFYVSVFSNDMRFGPNDAENFFSFLGFVGVGLCIMPVLFVVCYRLVQFLRGTVVRDQTVLRPLVPGSFEWEKIGAMELLRHPRDVIRTRKRTAPRKRVISDLVMSGFALLFAALSVILFFALAPKFKVTNLSVRFGYPTGSCPRSQNVYGDVQTNGFGDISYQFEFSDGTATKPTTEKITKTQDTVFGDWPVSHPIREAWVVLKILSPQNGLTSSEKKSVSIACAG
jgi:hypothetical protein